jgi:small subunit ribosomal protein SAe
MVDMYFYRDPEEAERQEEEAAEERKALPAAGEDEFATGETGEWGAETAATAVPTATGTEGEWGATGDWAASGATESWDVTAA